MGTNIMIPVLVPLIGRYKKYLYLLSASIRLQYSFFIRCGFYLWISASMNFFYIPTWCCNC